MSSIALLILLASSGVPASERSSKEADCRVVQAEVEAENSSNLRSLFLDGAFWAGSGVVAVLAAGCSAYLASAIPVLGLLALIVLATSGITGCVFSVLLLFDLVDLLNQRSPGAAYGQCMAGRNLPEASATAVAMAF